MDFGAAAKEARVHRVGAAGRDEDIGWEPIADGAGEQTLRLCKRSERKVRATGNALSAFANISYEPVYVLEQTIEGGRAGKQDVADAFQRHELGVGDHRG